MNKMQKIVLAIIVVAVVAGGAAVLVKRHNDSKTPDANSASSDPTLLANPPAEPTVTNQIQIKSMLFNPTTVKMQVGVVITWTNNDDVNHTITADTPSEDAPASKSLAKGETYSFTFKKAGTYTYHCDLHPSMKGTVIITE